MARYYYERYRVNSRTAYNWEAFSVKYTQGSDWAYNNQGDWSGDDIISVSTLFTFSASSGYARSGTAYNNTKLSALPSGLSYFYEGGGSTIYRWQITNKGGGVYGVYVQEQHAIQGKGDHVKYEFDMGAYYRTPNAVNSDGYYWERWANTSYSRGTYVDTIIAEDGTYPDNGRVGTTYWYVKKGRAFPELVVKADGQVKQGVDGWVKVEGELKRIVQMWTKTGGQLKES